MAVGGRVLGGWGLGLGAWGPWAGLVVGPVAGCAAGLGVGAPSGFVVGAWRGARAVRAAVLAVRAWRRARSGACCGVRGEVYRWRPRGGRGPLVLGGGEDEGLPGCLRRVGWGPNGAE